MDVKDLDVEVKDGQFQLASTLLPPKVLASTSHWESRTVGENRVIIQPKNFSSKKTSISECGFLSIEMYADLLRTLNKRKFSGKIHLDTPIGVKTVYLDKGALVCGTSTLIDDRLGEICYREDLITLDSLLNSAVQVDKKTKFGQVLIRDNIFTNFQLRNALRLQFSEIFKSVFMFESVYFELEPNAMAPIEIVFSHYYEDFVEQCHTFGILFREFKSRATESAGINVVDADSNMEEYMEGTFFGDLIQLSKNSNNVREFVHSSKLHPDNNLAALMVLFFKNIITIDPIRDIELNIAEAHFARLKNQIETYSMLLDHVREKFQNNEKELPVHEIVALTESLNDTVSYMFLTKNGHFSKECTRRMLLQSQFSPAREQFFCTRIECIRQFLLQLALDYLPYDVAKEIRLFSREMD